MSQCAQAGSVMVVVERKNSKVLPKVCTMELIS